MRRCACRVGVGSAAPGQRLHAAAASLSGQPYEQGRGVSGMHNHGMLCGPHLTETQSPAAFIEKNSQHCSQRVPSAEHTLHAPTFSSSSGKLQTPFMFSTHGRAAAATRPAGFKGGEGRGTVGPRPAAGHARGWWRRRRQQAHSRRRRRAAGHSSSPAGRIPLSRQL